MGIDFKTVVGLSFLTGGVRGATSGAMIYAKWVMYLDVIPVLLLVLNFKYGYTHSLSWGFWMVVWSLAYTNSCVEFMHNRMGGALVDCSQAVWNTFMTSAVLISGGLVLLSWVVLLPIQDWHWGFHIVIPGVVVYVALHIGCLIGSTIAQQPNVEQNKPATHINTPSELMSDTTLSAPIKWLLGLFFGFFGLLIVVGLFVEAFIL